MIERFRVASSGKITESADKAQVTRYLVEKMKLSPKGVVRVFSGRPLTLANNLEWKEANRLHRSFRALGLVTAVKLHLNEQCLKAGLQARESVKPDTEEVPAESIGFFAFDTQQLNPHLFAPAKETKVTDHAGAAAW